MFKNLFFSKKISTFEENKKHMELLTSFIVFIKIFTLWLSITNVLRNIGNIFKSVKTKTSFKNSKIESILLWFSISYILTIIII